IALCCLEKRPEDRYASAADLADDLDRFLDGQETRTPPPTAQRWRGTRGWLARPAGLALALGVGTLAAGVGWLSPPARPPTPARRAPASVRLDPLAAIDADLRAGRTVTLLRETGVPRWSRWRFETDRAPLRASSLPLRIRSYHRTMLELHPAVRLPAYRLRAEVQMYGGDIGRVGLYAGGVRAGAGEQQGHPVPLLPFADRREDSHRA